MAVFVTRVGECGHRLTLYKGNPLPCVLCHQKSGQYQSWYLKLPTFKNPFVGKLTAGLVSPTVNGIISYVEFEKVPWWIEGQYEVLWKLIGVCN